MLRHFTSVSATAAIRPGAATLQYAATGTLLSLPGPSSRPYATQATKFAAKAPVAKSSKRDPKARAGSPPERRRPGSTRGRAIKDDDKPERRPREKRELTASGLPKLSPYDLTKRLEAKCAAGNLDEAYDELQRMPRDAQDIVSWNTMIWHAMKAARFKLAHRMYNELKRRGFRPNTRTFRVMLAGYSRIQDWSMHQMNATHMHAIYASYEAHVAAVRKSGEEEAIEKEVTVIPVNYYLRCLANIGDFPKMWDVFNALPLEGPGAANAFTYATLLSRVTERKAPPDGAKVEPEDEQLSPVHRVASPSELKMYQRNGTDALLVWRMMLRAMERRDDLQLDPLPLTFTLQNLLRSPLEEHRAFAQGLLAEYYGLPRDGDALSKGRLPLSAHTLHVVLSSLVASRRHALCLHYGELARRHARFRRTLDVGHMDDMLAARAGLARPLAMLPPGSRTEAQAALETIDWMLAAEHDLGPDAKRIVPRRTSYMLALRACWHAVDWSAACTLFERMTGLRADAFGDTPDPDATPPPPRSPGRALAPDAECLANLLRTALATNGVAVRQALRMVVRFGLPLFFDRGENVWPSEVRSTARLAALVAHARHAVPLGKDGRDSRAGKKLGPDGFELYGAAMSYLRTYGHQTGTPQEDGARSQRRDTRSRLEPPRMTEEDEFDTAAAKLRETIVES